MYLVFLRGCRHAPHLSHSISPTQIHSQTQATLLKGLSGLIWPDAQSVCCPTTPDLEDSTNKVTYSCQNKKSISFPSLQSARLGIILEYFTKWLKDLDGVAFLTTL